MKGIVRDRKHLYTVVPSKFEGKSLYGEKIVRSEKGVLRSWNPYRSKLAAAILKGIKLDISSDAHILYLGAGAGTTVSHLSDLAYNGAIYAVEFSAFAMKKLIEICRKRNNIIPIFADASRPESYGHYIDRVDLIYQDISQRNQVDIFIGNCDSFLRKECKAILMVKAKSIDVTADPKEVYMKVAKQLKMKGYNIIESKKLDPYAKDHSLFVVSSHDQ